MGACNHHFNYFNGSLSVFEMICDWIIVLSTAENKKEIQAILSMVVFDLREKTTEITKNTKISININKS